MRKPAGVALFLLAISAASCGKRGAKNEAAGSAAPTVVAPQAAPLEVTGGELYKAYADDRDAADAKYEHKLVRLKGIVDDKGRSMLQIVAAGGADHINAWFPDEGKPLAGVKHHDTVVIRCVGGGKLDVPTLKDCVLEQIVPIAPAK
jgi:hypothetical protein